MTSPYVVPHDPPDHDDTDKLTLWRLRPLRPDASPENYVLVVEDDHLLRDMYRLILRGVGHFVVGVPDGIEALQLIAKQTPSVIVLDLALPRLGGHAVMRAVKSGSDTKEIPIVVVTGTDIRHVNLDECAAVLRKPIAAEQLVGAVEHALGSARGRCE